MNSDASSLRLVAGVADLETIRSFIEQRLTALGMAEDAADDLILAANEIVTNVIVHGYKHRPGPIEIVVQPEGTSGVVLVRDRAPVFDITTVPTPDITVPLEQRAPGGMGVHMARRFTDAMGHRSTPEGGNEVTLMKHNIL